MSSIPTVYIGYDPTEKVYCDVLEYSLEPQCDEFEENRGNKENVSENKSL